MLNLSWALVISWRSKLSALTFGSGVELKWAKGSSFRKSATPLDHADDWDVREYAPLSDISGTGSGSMGFIAKVM